MGAASVLNILSGLIKMKAVALLLGPAGVGAIGLFQNLMQSATLVSALGIGTVGTRQVAAAEAQGDAATIARVRFALFWGMLALALLGAGAFWLASGWIARTALDDAGQAPQVAWLALGVLLGVLALSQTALLSGMRRIGHLARLRVLSGIAATAGGIAAIWLWGLPGAVALVLLVPLTGVLLGLYYVRRLRLPQAGTPALPDLIGEWRAMVALGFTFMLSSLTMPMAELAVRTLIQRDLGTEALGQFQASWAIGMMYLTFILGAMSTDYYPRLSGVITDRPAASRMINEQTEVALLLCGPVLLGMLALAPWVIHLLYSRAFGAAVDILHWQLLGDVLKVLCWPLGFVVMAAGAGKTFALAQTLGAAAFVVVTYLALPVMGVSATGVGFIAIYLVILPINLFAAHRWTGYRWSRTIRREAGALLVCALAISGLFQISEPLAAGIGVPLALGFALYGLVRLSRMAGLGGRIGRIAAACERTLIRLKVIR